MWDRKLADLDGRGEKEGGYGAEVRTTHRKRQTAKLLDQIDRRAWFCTILHSSNL
jgi:hypothetical protein